jgi:hypothetical protein
LGFTAGMRKFLEPKGKDKICIAEVSIIKNNQQTEIANVEIETEGLGINYLIKIFPH